MAKWALLGLVNGAAAVAVLGLVEKLTPSDTGWFAYAPLNDIVVEQRSFAARGQPTRSRGREDRVSAHRRRYDDSAA